MENLELLTKKIHEKKTAPVKIMQFGEGNFLRAFVDWLIQKMNDSGKYEGHVVVVQPLPTGRVAELAKQDGLYTLILQGINDEGKAVKEHEVIDVLDDFVDPYADYAKYLKYAESKDLEVIVSNTTEAGIAYEEADTKINMDVQTPKSYPGKVLALLKHRYETLGKEYGLALIPCELIDDNGDKLKEVLIKLATEMKLSADFIDYITNSCHYTSTLVDRIVPGFPRDEFSQLCEQYGYVDNNMVKGEIFHLYVLKEEEYVMKKFPIHTVGLHAIYVPDVHPYKQRKVRILNGTHTTLVPVAYLAGFNEVRESLLDADVSKFILDEQKEEIVPTVTTKDAQKFADDVLQRFLNPYVHHQLMSIALNSISKFKERDLPTMLDDFAKGLTPSHMCFAFASLIKFYDGYRLVDGKKEEIKLSDTPEYITMFRKIWDSYYATKDIHALVETVMKEETFWGKDLTAVEGFEAEVEKWMTVILESSSHKEAIKKFLAK